MAIYLQVTTFQFIYFWLLSFNAFWIWNLFLSFRWWKSTMPIWRVWPHHFQCRATWGCNLLTLNVRAVNLIWATLSCAMMAIYEMQSRVEKKRITFRTSSLAKKNSQIMQLNHSIFAKSLSNWHAGWSSIRFVQHRSTWEAMVLFATVCCAYF